MRHLSIVAAHGLRNLAVLILGPPLVGQAQTQNSFTACTTGVISNCALIQLTALYGVGLGGTTVFEIALRNLGSQTSPTIATSIYNLVFSTGQAAEPGSEVDVSVAPTTSGGASISDPSEWSLFDSGDAVFLSALTNNGVGGCVAGAVVDGFGQAGRTCGDDQFLSFRFSTPHLFDPSAFTLLDYEVVGLTDNLLADSCGGDVSCKISAAPVTATPEPSSIALAITGLSGLAGIHLRRQRRDDHESRSAER